MGAPSLLHYIILKLYDFSWFSVITHTIAGIFGLIVVLYFYSKNPPMLVVGDESYFVLRGMWIISPIKTIFLSMAFIWIILSVLYYNIIGPILFKLYVVKQHQN